MEPLFQKKPASHAGYGDVVQPPIKVLESPLGHVEKLNAMGISILVVISVIDFVIWGGPLPNYVYLGSG
jgi:hypothetical protein